MGYFTNKVAQQPIGKLFVADYRHQDWTDYHYNRFRNKVWPLSAHSLLCTIAVIAFLHFEAVNPSFGSIDYIQDNFFPPIVGRNIVTLALSVGLFAVFVWFIFDQSLRYLISFALCYKGWVYDPVGQPSIATKVYMLFIKLLQRREPLFFSYQGIVPTMPLPALRATVEKYLKSMRPLLSDEEFDRQQTLADEFLSKGTAFSLQSRLRLKWLTSKNYVTDWWKEIVYMRHRGSLIKTNMAGVDVIFRTTTHLPAARAANLIVCNRMFENEIIHHQTMKPMTAGGVPLCSTQYHDFYRSLRVPGIETDHMIKLDDTARHVVVHCKGCWYKVNIFAGDRLLKASEIERAFQMIIDSQPEPSPGEEHLSALTGGERAVWAKIRSEEFSSGLNKDALDTIETALDVLWFDEEFRTYDERDPSLLDRDYARALHCDGFKCWWDKPQNMFFSANGKYSSTGEHSVCDALIFVHLSEYQKYHENFTLGFTSDGHARGAVELVPQPQRIRFDIPKDTQAIITKTLADNLALVHDYDNAAFVFYDYGKNYIKKCKVSPDAYLQMAIQIAYHKDQKKFPLTYEPTMARLWRDGRTETVRSCTKESVDFVMTMLDPAATREEKLKKLRAACEVHQQNYRDSMAGRGCDRHLFALRVVSKYYGVESPFLDAVFAQSFELSTSQTPQHQQEDLMKELADQKDFFWPSGSFACPDGSKYGICYTVGATGDILSFHISTWRSVENTDAKRFRSTLMNTLREMKQLLG